MNEKLIKLAHVAALAAIALAGLIFLTHHAISAQNTNASTETNTSSNSNQNTSGGGQMGGAGASSADRKFVTEAAMGGMKEVELGRLANERGASEAVRQFGQHMVEDHTRANQELMAAASAAGLTPPAALDAKTRAAVQKLSRLSGAEFDREYSKMMVKDHEKAVALFEREAARGTQSDLKSFASATLPTLQGHLQMARDLAASTGGRRNGSTNSNMPNTGTGSPRP